MMEVIHELRGQFQITNLISITCHIWKLAISVVESKRQLDGLQLASKNMN